MKYIVITSKHHDGFGLFPSELTDWCIKSTPFGRDPLKELAAACKDEGIRFCTYHSIMDWHHPDWGVRRAWNDRATGTPDMDRFNAYLKGQVTELVKNYHPAVMWFDGQWEKPWTDDRGQGHVHVPQRPRPRADHQQPRRRRHGRLRHPRADHPGDRTWARASTGSRA